ncbi:hypothetical protein [Pseudoalteromonas gelatinilytica]
MKYNIVFRGKLTAQDKKNVADSFLKKLLKIDSSELGSIYSGKPTILKSTDSKERALDIQTKLRQLGLDTRIIIKKNTEEKKDKQTTSSNNTTGNSSDTQRLKSGKSNEQMNSLNNLARIVDHWLYVLKNSKHTKYYLVMSFFLVVSVFINYLQFSTAPSERAHTIESTKKVEGVANTTNQKENTFNVALKKSKKFSELVRSLRESTSNYEWLEGENNNANNPRKDFILTFEVTSKIYDKWIINEAYKYKNQAMKAVDNYIKINQMQHSDLWEKFNCPTVKQGNSFIVSYLSCDSTQVRNKILEFAFSLYQETQYFQIGNMMEVHIEVREDLDSIKVTNFTCEDCTDESYSLKYSILSYLTGTEIL